MNILDEVKDIHWPQCCWLDNDNLCCINLELSRCPNPARWRIESDNEPRVDSCDEHLNILLERGWNLVTAL